MKILASTLILLTLLSACYPQYSQGRGGMGMGGGHEGNESAGMEALEGPGR
jgi:hypothetical protein